MKTMKAIGLTLVLALLAPAVAAQEEELPPGFVDFGSLGDVYGEPRVMVNIHGYLLKFIAAASAKEDPTASAVLRGLDGVRISVYPTDGNVGPAREQISAVRKVLQGQDWQPVVQVKETGEEVQIFMKADEDKMHGLTVMAVDAEEAVFINILGEIDPEHLDKVMDQFDVDVDMEAGDEA